MCTQKIIIGGNDMNFTQNIIVIVMTLIVLGGGVFAWWNSRVADDDFSNTIEDKDDE